MKASTVVRAFAASSVALAASAGAQITLYENENFGGRNVAASTSVSNLNDSGFNDRASSVIVRSGRWQICADAYFAGRCEALGPGEYPTLRAMGMNDKVSSVRSLGWTPDGSGGWASNPPPQWNPRPGYGGGGNPGGGYAGNWGTGSRAILYSDYNLSGEALAVAPEGITNLDWKGFNDKARSLRVESGYWIFCSDANFQGNCHTYAPGDYPSLPSGQSHSISSGRRISNQYPYRSNPNWGS